MKKKMSLLTTDMEKTQFVELFRKEVTKFREHARRVKIQYEQLKLLKENLPQGQAKTMPAMPVMKCSLPTGMLQWYLSIPQWHITAPKIAC